MSALQDEYRRRCGQEHDIREQLPVLYAWARHPGTRIIELGVRAGNSTSAFLAGIEHGRGELWSVDIARPDVPAQWHDLPSWHLLIADDLSDEAARFCPGEADVLFIDTSHYYKHTVAELDRYVPRVRPGGVALVHDTHNQRDWPDVPRALDDWCAAAGLGWYGHQAWPGLGVIEIPVAGDYEGEETTVATTVTEPSWWDSTTTVGVTFIQGYGDPTPCEAPRADVDLLPYGVGWPANNSHGWVAQIIPWHMIADLSRVA